MENLVECLQSIIEKIQNGQALTQQHKTETVAKLRPFIPKTCGNDIYAIAREKCINLTPHVVRNYLSGLTNDKHGLFEILVEYTLKHIEKTAKEIAVMKDLEEQLVNLQTAKNALSNKLNELKKEGRLNADEHKKFMSFAA